MNTDFDENLSDAAFRGLKQRLTDAPSEASIGFVNACAVRHAKRIRRVRGIRSAVSAVACMAACLALIAVVSREDSTFDAWDSIPAGDYRPYLALTALTTVFPDRDDGVLVENGLLLSDFDAGTDFDAFAESLLRMQDSACALDSTVAWD